MQQESPMCNLDHQQVNFTGSEGVCLRLDMSLRQNVIIRWSARVVFFTITTHMKNLAQVPPLAAAASVLQCAVYHLLVFLTIALETFP